MFEEFESKKYHINRPPPMDVKKCVAVEKRKMDFTCGECDGIIMMTIYYSSNPRKYIKEFRCTNCNLVTWR